MIFKRSILNSRVKYLKDRTTKLAKNNRFAILSKKVCSKGASPGEQTRKVQAKKSTR